MTDAPFQPHSETSQAAAMAIKPASDRIRQAIFEFIKSRGPFGATDDEIQREIGLLGNTQRPRRRELEKACRIKPSGSTRATSSGRRATVWVVA